MIILNEKQRVLAELGKEYAEVLRADAEEADRTRILPDTSLEVVRNLYSFMIPAGRSKPSMADAAILATELAKGSGPAALGWWMHSLAMGELGRHGVSAATRDYYWQRGAVEGFCSLISEPGSSSAVTESFAPQDLKAQRDLDGSWTLKGEKHFATFIRNARWAMVWAHWENHPNPHKVVCLIIPTSSLEIIDDWDTLGMRATRSDKVLFHGVKVGEEAFVYDTDAFTWTMLVEGSARLIGYMAVYQGIFERQLELTGASMAEREARPSPHKLGYRFDISSQLGECWSRVFQSRVGMLHAMEQFDLCGGTPKVLTLLLSAKLSIGQHTQDVTPSLVELMSARGLRMTEEFQRHLRDGETASIMPPNNIECRRQLGYAASGLDPMLAPQFL